MSDGVTSEDPSKEVTEPSGTSTATESGKSLASGKSEDGDGKAAQASPSGEGTQSAQEPAKEPAKETAKEVSLKLREHSPLGQEHLESVLAFAKDSGLTQEGAESLLASQEKLINDFTAQQARAFEKTRDGWIESVKSDKEIGGGLFDENVSYAKKATARFGTPELTKYLDSGVGDHPEIVRAFARIGRAMADDTLVRGPAAMTQKSFASKLYGKSTG